jgi:hypothetical protein
MPHNPVRTAADKQMRQPGPALCSENYEIRVVLSCTCKNFLVSGNAITDQTLRRSIWSELIPPSRKFLHSILMQALVDQRCFRNESWRRREHSFHYVEQKDLGTELFCQTNCVLKRLPRER